MSRRIVILLVLVLTSSSTLVLLPIKAQYQGSITINSDGSTSPSTAPIQQDNDVYMLTDDIIGSITVMASNITFNGNGHSIIGGLEVGVNYNLSPPMSTGASNVTVKNLIVENSVFGISLHKTSNSMVINNTILGTGPRSPFQ